MDYEKAHIARVNKYQKQIAEIFRKAIKEASLIGAGVVGYNADKPFDFNDYPAAKAKADKLFSDMYANLDAVVVNGVTAEWSESNYKNDLLAQYVLQRAHVGGDYAGFAEYFNHNDEVRDAFLQRKENGLGLSDKVWRYTDQFKNEIEMGLDIGLQEGKSAAELSLDLRGYLQNPDALFRRVRDSRGELHLSKKAKAYHPGQGVYRSAAKNAFRLTRTETNMAYRTADITRWQQQDFVVGYEVRRGGTYPCSVCDSLKGKYPKGFLFRGWHPACLCILIPILKTEEEFIDSLKKKMNGIEPNDESIEAIETLPPNFVQWMDENKTRLENARSTPYFIKDNFGNSLKNWENASFAHGVKTIRGGLDENQILDFAKKGTITEALFMDKNGEWSADRVKQVHNKIYDYYLKQEGTNEGYNYILGGATANGKSTLLDSGKLPHPKKIITVDADKIKSMLPEYATIINSGNKELIPLAANFVHEESSYLAKQVIAKIQASKRDFVSDAINDGGIENLIKKLAGYKKDGKPLRADYVTLDTDLSLKLAEARAKKTGRIVPQEVTKSANREVAKMFPDLLKSDVLDELYLWDTNINGQPRLILNKINGVVKIYDQSLYDRFLKKALD